MQHLLPVELGAGVVRRDADDAGGPVRGRDLDPLRDEEQHLQERAGLEIERLDTPGGKVSGNGVRDSDLISYLVNPGLSRKTRANSRISGEATAAGWTCMTGCGVFFTSVQVAPPSSRRYS